MNPVTDLYLVAVVMGGWSIEAVGERLPFEGGQLAETLVVELKL